jgi:tetratricopeptide (TPR) repeat protein
MQEKTRELKRTARLAGITYLISSVIAPFSLIYVPNKTIVAGNAAATAEKMLANEMLFRTSIALGIVSLLLFLFVALVQYKLFEGVNKNLASIMAILVIVQVPIAFVVDTFSITSLVIFKGQALQGLPVDQQQNIAMLLLKLSSNGTLLLMVFWGLWLIPFGQLCIKSGFIPRVIGWYLIVNGVTYIITSYCFILFPQYKKIIDNYSFPLLLGEPVIMLWFLIKGVHFRKVAVATIILISIAFGAHAQSNLQKGISLYQSKKLEEATKTFEAVDKTSGDYGAAQYYLGRISYDQKEYDDAVDYLKTATEKNPTNAEYFNWLGDAYAGVGSTSGMLTQMSVGPKALKAWEKAAELSPKVINARVSLVDSYIMAPEFMGGGEDKAKAMAKEVLPLLEESIKSNPENYLLQYRYGKITALTGLNLERGEECLLKYLTRSPGKDEPSHAGANMRLGQIKEKQGKKAEAKKYYETALKLDPKLEGAQKGLERVSK